MTSLRTIGSSDLEVFPLALGGNVFGWTADEAASFAVLDAYSAAGGNFVDTADSYSAWVEGNSGGESETVIGSWLIGHEEGNVAGGMGIRESDTPITTNTSLFIPHLFD